MREPAEGTSNHDERQEEAAQRGGPPEPSAPSTAEPPLPEPPPAASDPEAAEPPVASDPEAQPRAASASGGAERPAASDPEAEGPGASDPEAEGREASDPATAPKAKATSGPEVAGPTAAVSEPQAPESAQAPAPATPSAEVAEPSRPETAQAPAPAHEGGEAPTESSGPTGAQVPAATAQAAGRAETPVEGPGTKAEGSAPQAAIAEPRTAANPPEAEPAAPASGGAASTTGTSAATTAEPRTAANPPEAPASPEAGRATPAEAPTPPTPGDRPPAREPKHALGTRDNLRPVTLTPDARPGSGRHRRRSDDPDATDIIGVEDVLAAASGAAPIVRSQPRRHVQRARRSPWSRPRDKVIAVLIAVAVVAVGVTVWANSESRATISETAGPAPALPEVPAAVPAQLSELWQAPSGAAPEPIAAGKSVVTADGGELAGRDPLTGQVRWRYARDLQLCTAAEGWSRAVALFRKDGLRGETGCSEVIALDPDTGHREAQRTGSAQLGAGLVADSSYVTAFGHTLLNTWRDDLVETVEYGQVPALVNPGKQPRTGCTYGSVAMASSRVGVIERCPGDPGDRLTVYRAAPKDADQPQVSFSTLLPGVSGRLVAMSGDYVAVALADQKQLVLYGADGNEVSAYPLDLPPEDLANDPANGIPVTSSTPSTVYWFTGSKLVALSRDNLTPKWTLSSALGPGVLFDHQLVVPIQGGLAVLNEQDGSTIRTLGIDRHGYTGPVRLAAIGPVLLEQRGQTLVALR